MLISLSGLGASRKMNFKITYSINFLRVSAGLSDGEILKIKAFTEAAKGNYIANLPGRKKPSTSVSEAYAARDKLIQFAVDNDLWHYHIGHIEYNKRNRFGDWTSSHILHYQKNTEKVRLIHYAAHPPFIMPLKEYLI